MSERTEGVGLEFAEMRKMDKNALDEFAFRRVLLVRGDAVRGRRPGDARDDLVGFSSHVIFRLAIGLLLGLLLGF